MYARIPGSILALALTVGITTTAHGQTLLNLPVPTLPAPAAAPPPSIALSRAGQIADRPTADLRPRFHWGIFGSVIPNWSIPGSMGNLFFETPNSPKMSGRDFRIGVVRGRQLGFEMGGSFVRKTVSGLNVASYPSLASSVTYTAPNAVHMMGVDGHLVIPFARIGERLQLGVLAGGGMAWLPDTPVQVRIEGPPFYADANLTVPLSSPPASGGFVPGGGLFGTEGLPLVPGTPYGVTDGMLRDISPTDAFWMLLRGQLAADFLLAPPLKVRLTAGFHYPGMQALGVDVIYLFRTGRVSTDPGQPQAGPAAPPQIADQPDVIAPRRSYWGVLAGATPRWWTPDSWGPIFEPDDPTLVEGREFRIGFTRGRPLGYEFGASFVRKSMTRFTFERAGMPVFSGIPGNELPPMARITLTALEPVQIPGADFHAFIPIDRIGSRVQVGALLGLGAARVPDTPIQKRIAGPPFFADATSTVNLTTPPAAGAFVVDDDGERIPVAPGQTEAIVMVGATEISPLGSLLFLARGQIAADVLVARPLKLRFSAGFNYPGAQLFGVEVVYLFGTGRN